MNILRTHLLICSIWMLLFWYLYSMDNVAPAGTTIIDVFLNIGKELRTQSVSIQDIFELM